MQVLEHQPKRYYRTPHLQPTNEGGALLSLRVWEGASEYGVSIGISATGSIASEQKKISPTIGAMEQEDSATAGEWKVRIERENSLTRVVVQAHGFARSVAWEGRGIAAAPYIVATADGAWVAFHHDIREDTGVADVAKWIGLRFINFAGEVFQPVARMPDVDRDAGGEQQSFEFPTLVVGDDGALDLFGRGSHNFYRQRLTAKGWTAREALSDGTWGCRGRRVALCRIASGATLSARRERKGIAIQTFEMSTGGKPALERIAPSVIQSVAGYVLSPRPTWHGPRVLFGDLHQHSAHSDGIGIADEAYLRARYRYEDDFAALTDHESFLGKRTGPGEWDYLQSVAERHNEPETFSTLFAYEWTARSFPGPGHKCLYFEKAGAPVISRDDVPEGAELLRRLKLAGGIAAPHHIGWTGADAAAHDPSVQPVWEMCSCHGCYECANHPLGQRGELHDQMVRDMLNRGLRFGLIASSDSHGLLWHHGVARQRDPFRTGLTAIISTSNSRVAIMQALRARRCYATSGAKILIDLEADGSPMGSELSISTSLNLVARVQGTAPLARLEWIGPEGVLQSTDCSNLSAETSAKLSARWIYLRVTQSDGQMAWTSPIFTNV